MHISRPLLQWHGGKWTLGKWIIGFFPRHHHVYVEPFGGAASVLIQKKKCHTEVYNELDDEVVNLFRVLRGPHSETLVRLLELTPFARSEFRLSYEPTMDDVERARRLLVRSFMGHGTAAVRQSKSGFRSNAAKAGSSPVADWRSFPDELRLIVDRLKDVVVENERAVSVIERHDSPVTLFYVDPPYVPGTRDKGRDYKHEMTLLQHEVLLRSLLSVKGMVLLSGYRCDLYDRMLSGWTCYSRSAHADGGLDREECLWLNPAAEAARADPDMLIRHGIEPQRANADLPDEFGADVSYDELRRVVQARSGVQKGWQMAFSRFAGVNIMTVQTWRERGLLPPGFLHKANQMTKADAKALLPKVKWSPAMHDRLVVLLDDGIKRTYQTLADILSEEFEQPVQVSHIRGAVYRVNNPRPGGKFARFQQVEQDAATG